MAQLTEEKAELIRQFEELLEGVENKYTLAALCASLAEKFAEKKLKENVAPKSGT